MSIKEDFYIARKAAMKEVQQKEAARIVGKCKGHSSISRAAWALVAGRPEYAEYLYGNKVGTAESYEILEKIKKDAVRLLNILNFFRLDYYRYGNFEHVWDTLVEDRQTLRMLTAERAQNIYNSKEVLRQQSSDKRENRLQNCKKYLKFTVCFLLGAAFYHISSSLCELLFLTLLFSAYILLSG